MSQADKFTPRTKHITLKYHWFKEYAKSGLFNIEHVDTRHLYKTTWWSYMQEVKIIGLWLLMSS